MLSWLLCVLPSVAASQVLLNMQQTWSLECSTVWDVLGPFPISAREQHFISPSFPLDLSKTPYDHEPNRTWPSSLADGGNVAWKPFTSTANGRLLVSHTNIRWSSLRATEGWAALQHHSVLHTTLTITPPSEGQHIIPWLSCSLRQVSFFALVPAKPTLDNFTLEWHPGNIYALPRSPKQLIELPALSLTKPTIYHLFVSGDYEIRLLGDPEAAGHHEPMLDINVNFSLESRNEIVQFDPSLHVVCDFVQGWAFGNAIGLGIRVLDGYWEVTNIEALVDLPLFTLSLLQPHRLSPSQTRIVPITIKQHAPFTGNTLQLRLTLTNSQTSETLLLESTLDVRHRSSWDNTAEHKAIKATYFLADTPTAYLAIPPSRSNTAVPKPPIIALHGAGVDIFNSSWATSLMRQRHSWLILPTGRTTWGLDWHGPSANDAWGSLAALTLLLSANPQWASWAINNDSKVVVIGHSNGGQGTWYIAARYPDRVLAAVSAAAYIKSQQYIPLTLSRGAHFIDPSHAGILAASLAPDDNDLFLSNLVDTRILAIHGGNDENVPTWHSRELVGLVKSWRNDANISFLEDSGKPHWYPDVLSSPRIQTFLSSVLDSEDPNTSSHTSSNEFTLTVANPDESGSFHGVSIREVEIPGRLAKLRVSQQDGFVTIKTSNVYTFSIHFPQVSRLSINGMDINLNAQYNGSEVWIQREDTSWKTLVHPPQIRIAGPISRILSSPSHLLIVIPSEDQHIHSIARRLAHAMLLYFRIDTEIITDVQALAAHKTNLTMGDTIVIGSSNNYGQQILRSGTGIVTISSGKFTVYNQTFTDPSIGLLFHHAHPSSPDYRVVFLCGTDNNGLERVSRLLMPIRTGVPLPEFLIVGKEADDRGTGGIQGGGFWSRIWTWNEAMAWLH